MQEMEVDGIQRRRRGGGWGDSEGEKVCNARNVAFKLYIAGITTDCVGGTHMRLGERFDKKLAMVEFLGK